MRLRSYDLFAGAGLATLGLRNSWQSAWANELAPQKPVACIANFGTDPVVLSEVADITANEIPTSAEMAWPSFACQSLSLAAWRGGLSAERRGQFWALWHIMYDLSTTSALPIVVIENTRIDSRALFAAQPAGTWPWET